jgi:hypothetical protein
MLLVSHFASTTMPNIFGYCSKKESSEQARTSTYDDTRRIMSQETPTDCEAAPNPAAEAPPNRRPAHRMRGPSRIASMPILQLGGEGAVWKRGLVRERGAGGGSFFSRLGPREIRLLDLQRVGGRREERRNWRQETRHLKMGRYCGVFFFS